MLFRSETNTTLKINYTPIKINFKKVYLRKQEKSQINNLTLYLKQLEKEQKKPKVRRRKEIIKIRAEINEKEKKEMIAKINKTKARSLRR